ncbi:integration host factor subunit alpha [Desulfopila aestuarii]|uniref:Integration host factor subunit alpha n=1 Tax=Desulfopila aestuarii DSM 18488 TaxID=1121416 RepID=A0A1M7YKL1_9BACT|nr:integration host factor subunit alpha [Desulfopila aestuarii]SHO53153.1 integration host factor subunit alpha [Desulfopila aestuarii DSM 18488]
MNSSNLTRKDLAEAISNQLGYPQSSCADIVDSFLDTMKQALLDGETIKLVHFGTFSVRDKQPRRGRNPRTGESITIKKRQTVSFRPSKKLREQINV